MMSRAAQTHLVGHMRPAGRVFETPAFDIVHFVLEIDYKVQQQQ